MQLQVYTKSTKNIMNAIICADNYYYLNDMITIYMHVRQ